MELKDKLEAMYSDGLVHPDIFEVSLFHCGYMKAIKDVLKYIQ